MGKVKTHSFNKVSYDIHFTPTAIEGKCDYPRCGSRPSLEICCEPKTKGELISIIHESLHAEDWSKAEEIVDRVSKDIGGLLWRLGYRRK